MFVTAVVTTLRTQKQARCPLTDELYKEVVVHIYNEYYSTVKRNENESVERRWMNLEPVIQSEESRN